MSEGPRKRLALMKKWNEVFFRFTPTDVEIFCFGGASDSGRRRILEAMESWAASHGAGQPDNAVEWVDYSTLSLFGINEALDERHMAREFRLTRDNASDLTFRGVFVAGEREGKEENILGRRFGNCEVNLFRTESNIYVLKIVLSSQQGLFIKDVTRRRVSTHASPAELFGAVNGLTGWERSVAESAWNKASS